MSPFHARTAGPISTKFCTDLPTNSGKILNTVMIPPTPKPKRVTGEKTLCNVKCSDGYPYTIQLISQAAPVPSWLVYIKRQFVPTYVCTCVPLSQVNRHTNLRQILYRPPH